jgi:ubiquinone/menaquinone biosynthesis C-methylase UbiE
MRHILWRFAGYDHGMRYTMTLAAIALLMLLPVPAAAQLAGRTAQDWINTLDAPARVASMRVPEMVAALKIVPGQIVADVGAGSGSVSGPLAIATGPKGLMYAVDIDQGLLTHIAERAAKLQLTNIRTVLGAFTDPKLPAPVDLAFMNDVLHHVQDRAAYLKSLATYLKPGGRLAIVDFHPDKSPHAAQPELTVGEAQTEAWLKAAGLVLSEKVPLFDDRFYLIYRKP